jgi:hypothetical protein
MTALGVIANTSKILLAADLVREERGVCGTSPFRPLPRDEPIVLEKKMLKDMEGGPPKKNAEGGIIRRFLRRNHTSVLMHERR